MAPRTVLLCGTSLLLSGVASCLADSAGLNVTRAASPQDVTALFTDGVPDVVICDINLAHDYRILNLLVRNPHVLFLGLDPECDRAVLLAGHEARALTAQKIVELVAGTPAADGSRNGRPHPDP